MKTRERIAIGLALLLTLGSAAVWAQAQEKGAAPSEKQGRGGGMPDMIGGLKKTPGCLGVETARTSSGKQVIFAWFKDKKSVLDWYKSDMHVGLMKSMGAGEGRGLVNVPDDAAPIMVVASLTPSDKPKIEAAPMPISQISIEIYQPLPGGASVGGTFAPKGMEIPKMKRYDEEKPADAEKAKSEPQ